MRDPETLAKVKNILNKIETIAPGNSVELRIPPYAAIQCVEGLNHRRGTPPNVVEMQSQTLFDLVTGEIDWNTAIETGQIQASGQRSNLENIFDLLKVESRIQK